MASANVVRAGFPIALQNARLTRYVGREWPLPGKEAWSYEMRCIRHNHALA
jgi:hypothetical protein